MTNLEKLKCISVEDFLKQCGFETVDAECIFDVLQALDELTCFGGDLYEPMASCHFCNGNVSLCNSDSEEVGSCRKEILSYLNSVAKE